MTGCVLGRCFNRTFRGFGVYPYEEVFEEVKQLVKIRKHLAEDMGEESDGTRDEQPDPTAIRTSDPRLQPADRQRENPMSSVLGVGEKRGLIKSLGQSHSTSL